MIGFTDLALGIVTYLIAHIIVLCIYSVTLHPYAKYPGPLLAKFTGLYGAYYAYTGDIHLDVERCHEKYGKIVRYRPNGLLINSPEAFHDIHGVGNKFKKAKSYDSHGIGNLLAIQDKKEYAKKKKIFQHGFSDTANREHEPKMIEEINTFVEKMAETEGSKNADGWTNSKNMSLWCNWLTTDVVTKVIFTTCWDLMTSTANRGLPETFKKVVRLVGVLHYWPHIQGHEYTVVTFLPHLALSVTDLKNYALSVMASSRAAKEKDPLVKNVFSFFSEYKDPDTGELALTHTDVRRNTGNFIVAGSDTTASSISATFFYLTHNPSAYAKVAQEIRSTFPRAESIRSGPALNNCHYLRAAINESMRMAPVAPQPLWRESESDKVYVDGIHIPQGYNAACNIFSIHHNPTAFPDPYHWDMNRWLVKPEKEENAEKERLREMNRSFAPFSVGSRQCIAKNFALMELYLSLALVIWNLDFECVGTKGEGGKGQGRGRERKEEFQFKSYFTSYMEGPMVRFRRREV